jgi:glucose-1-phosphate cytidylyltransferase
MDTLRDKAVLQEQWDSGKPPWCVWNNEPAALLKEVSKSNQPAIATRARI